MTATAKVLYLTDVWEERRPTLPEPPEPTKGLLAAAIEDAYAEFLQAVDVEIDAFQALSVAGAAAYAAGWASDRLTAIVAGIADAGYGGNGVVLGWAHAHGVRIRPQGKHNPPDPQAKEQRMDEFKDAAETLQISQLLRADAKAAVFDAMAPAYRLFSLNKLNAFAGGDKEFNRDSINKALRARDVEIRHQGSKPSG